MGSEGIGGDDRDQCRIDAAREAQQHLFEPGLGEVIFDRDHHGPVIGLDHAGHFGFDAFLGAPALRGLAKGHGLARGIKLRQLHRHGPVRVHHERRPVKHLIVLPADHIQIDQRQPGIAYAPAHQIDAHSRFTPVVGRAVGHQQDLGPRLGMSERDAFVPGILADRGADLNRAKLERHLQGGRSEDPLFVEHRIIGQIVLQHLGQNAAVLEIDITVKEQAAAPQRAADGQCGARPDPRGEGL